MLKIVCAAKFLERPTLNNPKGGPMSGPGSEYLSQMAQESLRKVDAQRRHEFLRRKEDKDVEEKAEIDNRILQIRRNFGWPFSIGLVSEGDMQENYEPPISFSLNPSLSLSLSLSLSFAMQENYEPSISSTLNPFSAPSLFGPAGKLRAWMGGRAVLLVLWSISHPGGLLPEFPCL